MPTSSLPFVWWKRGRLHAVRRLPAALAVHPEADHLGLRASAPWAVMASHNCILGLPMLGVTK